MIINAKGKDIEQFHFPPLFVNPCKCCGRDPLNKTRWEQKARDPMTEIPVAYYIICPFCDMATEVRSCKKAKTPEERFKVLKKVVEEWNELNEANKNSTHE